MNEIKLNPDGPDEHGSFTHPKDCMCHDCLPGSNRLPAPNAGEKCPVCDGEKVIIMEQLCFRCKGTGLKPAVESPAADFKERDASAKLFAEHTKEIADLTTKLAELKGERNLLKLEVFHKDDHIADLNTNLESNQKELTTLRTENQGLVKEVERLRESIGNIADLLRTAHLYPAHLTANWMQDEVKKALKPTPEGSGSKRNP